MRKCEICGKPTALSFHFCRTCNEKIKNGELEKCPHCGEWKESNKPCTKCGFPVLQEKKSLYPNCKKTVKNYFGEDIMFDSKEEIKIANIIVENGYVFDHDQEYPYPENQNGMRYDFRLLKRDRSDFQVKTFVEAKCDKNRDFTQEILKKKEMCDAHGDKLIYSNECKQSEIIEMLRKTIEEIKKEN